MTTHVMTSDRHAGRRSASAAAGNGMNGGLPTGSNHILHGHVLSRAVDELHVKYGSVLDAGLIRRTVTGTYRDLERTARIKTFLPLLATRAAEDRLRTMALAAEAGRPDGDDAAGAAAVEAGTGRPVRVAA